MKSVMLIAITFTACATTGVPAMDREPHTGSRVELDLVPRADATRVFPQALDPRLPAADRVAHQIRAELGDVASIEVRLCVAAEGRVTSVEVVRSSTMPTFDRSVIADAMQWKFAALPGPTSARTCERATITYRPHA